VSLAHEIANLAFRPFLSTPGLDGGRTGLAISNKGLGQANVQPVYEMNMHIERRHVTNRLARSLSTTNRLSLLAA
jgi:hypothetical protein